MCTKAVEDYKLVCSSREENVKLERGLKETIFKSGSSAGNMIYFICWTSITRWSVKICFLPLTKAFIDLRATRQR